MPSEWFHLLVITGRGVETNFCELFEPIRTVEIILLKQQQMKWQCFVLPLNLLKSTDFLFYGWVEQSIWPSHRSLPLLVLINQFWQLGASWRISSNVVTETCTVFVWLSNFSTFSFSFKFEVLFPERLVLQSPQVIKTQNATECCGVDDGLEQCSQQERKVSIL